MTYTPLKVGDKVVVIDTSAFGDFPHHLGDELTVTFANSGLVAVDGNPHCWREGRFRLANKIEAPLTLPVLIFGPDVDVLRIPRRGYDFEKGDRRFFDQQEAIAHANQKALETGVRQIVRVDRSVETFHGLLHLVQAVGS